MYIAANSLEGIEQLFTGQLPFLTWNKRENRYFTKEELSLIEDGKRRIKEGRPVLRKVLRWISDLNEEKRNRSILLLRRPMRFKRITVPVTSIYR